MTKTQKIWMSIFLAMFIIPELLWSPVLNYLLPFFYGSSYKFRDSVLFSGKVSPIILGLVIFIQVVGLVLSTIGVLAGIKEKKQKYILSVILGLVSLLSFLVLCLHIIINQSDFLGL